MSSIRVEHAAGVVTVTLNRPAVRNAFDEALIAELTAWARGPMPAGARAAVLRGEGTVFCAGADLAWMSRMLTASQPDNLSDARTAADLFEALDTLPLPLIGRVHGAALGGGAGLVAVCDIVVAADDAVFGFTEARLGIVPAMIAPYAIAKIGASAARELFLTAARFSAARAREIGLAHAVVPAADLDATVDAYVREIGASGPEAVATAKRLIADVRGRPPRDVADLTARAIAERRVSPEGQEGMRAFLEKRRPSWVRNTSE